MSSSLFEYPQQPVEKKFKLWKTLFPILILSGKIRFLNDFR